MGQWGRVLVKGLGLGWDIGVGCWTLVKGLGSGLGIGCW